ncbi:lysophospholipid acyltransferase family protein [Novosphingobium beihaiensis]|uniref:1-acyl-sn-glycerol-3-phosphate acyltransferase n=1 Tax=Novosphingobium beihaiensis TaxID=2930389 RepID=A0ABT0BNR6_9SPHN|nr:lysophospholipid acyltransferase family protein [Novosphingobium beihaiensis]MCJ2186684.1 1-acyl-sn-glycerol-3-phosphate acyltransferase [Novosphingobium beihaiensis]
MRSTPADILRSLAFYAAFYSGTVGFVLAASLAMTFSDAALRRIVCMWSHYHRLCARLLLGIRVVIEGDLPNEGVLVAVKHESFFEAIDLPAQMDRPVPLPKMELIRIPGWGKAAMRYGVVAIEREGGARTLRKMVASGRAFATQGRPLVIFPEGTRVPHGERRRLQSGFAGLYKLLNLPVVPVAVNSGPLYHRRWKKPGTITVRVGQRIEPGLAREELEARVLEAINALNG